MTSFVYCAKMEIQMRTTTSSSVMVLVNGLIIKIALVFILFRMVIGSAARHASGMRSLLATKKAKIAYEASASSVHVEHAKGCDDS